MTSNFFNDMNILNIFCLQDADVILFLKTKEIDLIYTLEGLPYRVV